MVAYTLFTNLCAITQVPHQHLLSPVALFLGIVGVVACKGNDAKARAVDMIMFGGIVTGLLGILFQYQFQ